MKLLTISKAAHDALVRAANTRTVYGSAATKGGKFLLQVDDETAELLNYTAASLGKNPDETIIHVCR